jgi:hypothetical protein
MTLDTHNVHVSFTGAESVKAGDIKSETTSEVQICGEQAGRPNIAQQFNEGLELLTSSQNARSSTFTRIVNEWLYLQKRMINALTPRPLDATELGGYFDAPINMGNPEPSDVANTLDPHAMAACDLELVDLDKTIRYNAVWRIICSGEARPRPDLILPANLRHLGILDD